MEAHGDPLLQPPPRGGGGGGGGGLQEETVAPAGAASRFISDHEGGDARRHGGSRAQGWSSLTRLLRNPSPPRDPFPPLTGAAAAAASSSISSKKKNNPQQQHQQQQVVVLDDNPPVPSNSGDRSQQRGGRGRAGGSPASSTGSFSSNFSAGGGRNSWGEADTQAAFSSNAIPAPAAPLRPALGPSDSPPESSSGSFAPSALLNHSSTENRHAQQQSRRGGSGSPAAAARAASSAGSFSPHPGYWVQAGGGAFGAHAGGGRDSHPQTVVVDEGGSRRDESRTAAERDGGENVERPSVSDGRSSIGGAVADRDLSGAREQGRDGGGGGGDSTAASSALQVPMEPEWEEEDLYLRVRSDALKEARARDRFARGASQAYVRGDHRKAKSMSKQAQVKRLIAEKLHAEAAFEILNHRNKPSSFDVWHLDLHGLHSAEAVAALESRLALLEHGLAEDQNARLLSSAIQLEKAGQDQLAMSEDDAEVRYDSQMHEGDKNGKLVQSLIPASKLLSVVTGVGAHSQGGPTLPSAVKSFLINNGYRLEEPRAGVVSVHPKLRFIADTPNL